MELFTCNEDVLEHQKEILDNVFSDRQPKQNICCAICMKSIRDRKDAVLVVRENNEIALTHIICPEVEHG